MTVDAPVTELQVIDMDDVCEFGITLNELFPPKIGSDLRGLVGDLEPQAPKRSIALWEQRDTCGW